MDYDITFNTIKDYPDMIKIIIYREPLIHSRNRSSERRKDADSTQSSVSRTRTVLEDLCICNQFDLFCTFTFDPKKIDSKNLLKCRQFMHNWLRNAKYRHSRHLEYLVVPELHKSGALHFHALFKNYEGELKDSGKSQNGRTIYNLRNWRFGFSTAVKIDNQEAVSRYIRKYITKDMVLLPGKKRYFCSQGLVRPKKYTNSFISFLRKVPSQFSCSQDAEFYTIFKKDIDNLDELMLNWS